MVDPKVDERNTKYAVPYPYPAPGVVVGVSVVGNDELMPRGCWVQALRSEETATEYEFTVCAKAPDLGRASNVTALDRINTVLITLGMPRLDSLVNENEGVYQELAGTILSRGEECIIHYRTTRETFETLYRFIATSDYVQLSYKADIGYVVGGLAEKEQQQLYQLYRKMVVRERPLIAVAQQGALDGELTTEKPEIFPIIDRELELVGMMTLKPLRIISINKGGGMARCTAEVDEEKRG